MNEDFLEIRAGQIGLQIKYNINYRLDEEGKDNDLQEIVGELIIQFTRKEKEKYHEYLIKKENEASKYENNINEFLIRQGMTNYYKKHILDSELN